MLPLNKCRIFINFHRSSKIYCSKFEKIVRLLQTLDYPDTVSLHDISKCEMSTSIMCGKCCSLEKVSNLQHVHVHTPKAWTEKNKRRPRINNAVRTLAKNKGRSIKKYGMQFNTYKTPHNNYICYKLLVAYQKNS